jgi:methylated-DNA-protein-cysteine methyltransferase-like protein
MIMSTVLNEDLLYLIYSIVEEIPEGCVATYGQIAKLIGRERNSRLVGRALKMAFRYGNFPCHRVVNHEGRVTPGWNEQISLLKIEGVTFRDDCHVDLKKHRWKI